jgi:hypothetical protein
MLRYGLKKKMLKNQRGGFSRVIANLERRRKKPQKGGFLKSLERSMFGVRRTKGKAKRPPQKGAGWFDNVSQGMFGIKQTRGKKKREPAVIHSSARSYPQKGGFYGRNPQRDVDKFHSWVGRKTGRKAV